MRKILLLNATLVAICFYSTFSYSAEYWARFYNYGSYPSYGSYPPRPRSIQQTSDEGYLVAGYSNTPFINSPIFFKIDKIGNVLSGKDFVSINICSYSSIRQTSDGGYIVASSDMNTYSIPPTFILKLDCTGNILWQKAFEGILSLDIQQTSDGGYVVAGIGRLNPDTAPANDFCVLKLDKDGNILWQKTYGDKNEEFPSSIQQTKDGGYIVAGNFMYYPSSSSDYLSWVLKLDESGNIEWQKTYDFCPDMVTITQTADGGYITSGLKFYGSMSSEAVILKLDKDGNILWQKAYGDNAIVSARYILQTSEGSYLVTGTTDNKTWLLKIAEGGNILWQRSFGDEKISLHDPAILENKNGQYLMACSYSENTSHYGAILLLKLDKNGIIPGCEIVKTNNLLVSNISIGWSNTTVNPYATSIVPTISNIVPVDNSPVVNTICFQDSLNANAGPDQTVFDTVTFDGSGSYAENGQIVSFTWELKHRENSAYNRTSTGVTSTITNLAKGFYDVTLTIADDSGATGQDTMLLSAAGSCEISTLIGMSSFTAIPSDEEVMLKWKTETEINNTGFNIWRAEGFRKMNESFIPALGSPVSGAEYNFADEWVLNGKRYFYLLEDIDTSGISTFHGPVKATPRWIYGVGK